MDLQHIRQRTEQFLEELGREEYLEGAGLKEQVNLSALYEKYAELSTKELTDYLREQWVQAQGDERKRIMMLLERSTQNVIENYSRQLDDERLTTELNGVVRINQEEHTIPFRNSFVAMMNESNRERREAISSARDTFIAERLNPIYERALGRTYEAVDQLGYQNYVSMSETLSGTDLSALSQMSDMFLRQTEDMYQDVLGWSVRRKMGIPLGRMRYHDLVHLMRAQEFDLFFPAETMLPTFRGFVESMGIDIAAGGNITLDIETRSKKSPRAFCVTVKIPNEIYLVTKPHGGQEDYHSFLHELGHALHYGFTDPLLEFEFKYLGDYSVTEGFAATFDHLMQNRVWIKKVLGIQKPDDYLKFVHFKQLSVTRRYSAKLAYELALHNGSPVGGKQDIYRNLLTNATKVEYPASHYLYDVDPFFYCARYLRAWMTESILSHYLSEHFDEDWFLNPKAGQFLKDLWNLGQKDTAEELIGRLGHRTLTLGLIRASISRVLS